MRKFPNGRSNRFVGDTVTIGCVVTGNGMSRCIHAAKPMSLVGMGH